MILERLRSLSALLLAGVIALAVSGCADTESKGTVRVHLEFEGDDDVTFLAIDTSEEALETATNRLKKPIPGKSVYSAVLSRPGNYWIRAGVETEGYIVERLEGPIRAEGGVANWQFKEVDSHPLYDEFVSEDAEEPAGRISFSNN